LTDIDEVKYQGADHSDMPGGAVNEDTQDMLDAVKIGYMTCLLML
jgi:hypothetical protein